MDSIEFQACPVLSIHLLNVFLRYVLLCIVKVESACVDDIFLSEDIFQMVHVFSQSVFYAKGSYPNRLEFINPIRTSHSGIEHPVSWFKLQNRKGLVPPLIVVESQ